MIEIKAIKLIIKPDYNFEFEIPIKENLIELNPYKNMNMH
jgi:hypothetical protein